MSGHEDPPEGTPDGVPAGGDDEYEYRSVVFDESFVKAARIQEYSARERLDDATHAVHIRHAMPRGIARQALAMFLLIMVAFGFAVYMGVRHPYRTHAPAVSEQIRVNLIPLVPKGTVPEVSASTPFAGTGAEGYQRTVILPSDAARRIGGYAQSEVQEALDTAKEYLTDTSLDPGTVIDGDLEPVRDLLSPSQLDQFDDTLSQPSDDGRHAATGWLVRFDPTAGIALVGAGKGVRVNEGKVRTAAAGNALEIVSDYTFVYALHGTPNTGVSLFTVRRQLTFHFDHSDLRQHHIELVDADVQAGPLGCTDSVGSYFRPILAGGSGGAVNGTDPYHPDGTAGSVCTTLDTAGAGPTGSATAGATAPAATVTGPTAAAPGTTAATTTASIASSASAASSAPAAIPLARTAVDVRYAPSGVAPDVSGPGSPFAPEPVNLSRNLPPMSPAPLPKSRIRPTSGSLLCLARSA
ncbi:hypothetical protein SAMN05216223_11766 [Actinacidiphila yanglinensis]|uniref:Uncharacterized protein n=1 Tax=Actinacidiphila yanglinensis TaxID=310779 RepID=A0A1H6DM88_9ACTN|nr:hypothetical protein SAMN05216223_11766 [Actinacidiphila yanglinensis]